MAELTPEERLIEDRRLLNLARAGDVAAFEQLVDLHSNRVYRLAQRMMGNAQDAQEITQETFLSAFQNMKGFRGDSAFGSWVHRIAANFALMRLRHRKVVHEAESELKGEMEFTEEGVLLTYPLSQWSRRADDQALDGELRAALSRAVDALPDGYRAVFLLKDVEGLSYEEIAEQTEETIPAVKSRLHRARLALRQSIDEFYGERRTR